MNLVGIDVATARVTAIRVDERGAVLARATETPQGDIREAARAAYRAVRHGTPDTVLGVALPFPSDDIGADVRSALADETPAHAVLVASGQAAALAERWCGAAQGYRDVIAFSIADHVTAGILIGDHLLTGAHGQAGSVAWLTLNPVEREDYRRRGGLEAEVAAAGIVRRLVWRIKSGDTSDVLNRVDGDLSRLTADDVVAAAREGDGVCVSVIRDTAKYVGMAIANLAVVLDPECVVLGGGLVRSADLMLDAIRTECSRRLGPAQSAHVRIVVSALGDDAPAIGAARAAMLQAR